MNNERKQMINHMYYINLDKRVDRRSHFENQMKLLNWHATRFPAIENKNGALGCSLSHLQLLEHAKCMNYEHILIMEDDIMFLNPTIFLQQLEAFLCSDIDFDVLLIAGNNTGPYTPVNNNTNNTNTNTNICVKVTHCQTTTGYLVKNAYFDTLIENIREGISGMTQTRNLSKYAIDQHWGKLQEKDKWFLLTPLTVTQKPDYSDIEKRPVNYNKPMLSLEK